MAPGTVRCTLLVESFASLFWAAAHAGDRRLDFPVGTRITIGGGELGYLTVVAEPSYDEVSDRPFIPVAPDRVISTEVR